MSCIVEEIGGVQTAIMSFKRESLLYDIENSAHIEGRVLETENPRQRHDVQAVGDEGNVDRITRVLDLAIARCRELLYAYTKHEVHRRELTDRLKERPVYGIVLSLPAGFSQTTLNLISELVHEYMVCKGAAEWMSLTNPAKVAVWEKKADDALTEIRESMQTRMIRVRRRMHPF